MADVDVLRTLAAIALAFVIPGYFLTKAIFPNAREISPGFPELFVAAMSVVLSVALAALVGLALGALPPDPATGTGQFRAQNTLAALLLISALFALLAWRRGAFPRLTKRAARFVKAVAPPAGVGAIADDPKAYARERELRARRVELLGGLRLTRGKAKPRGRHRAVVADVEADLRGVDAELAALRRERVRKIAEAQAAAQRLEGRRRERRNAVLTFFRLKRAGGPPQGPRSAK